LSKASNYLPVIAMRGLTVFPYIPTSFDVSREVSVAALDAAMEEGSHIFLVSQINPIQEEPTEKDLYTIGTIAKIKQVLRPKDEPVKVLVEGIRRGKMLFLDQSEDCPYDTAMVEPIERPKAQETPEEEAMMRSAIQVFSDFMTKTHQISPVLLIQLSLISSPDELADTLIVQSVKDAGKLQQFLEILDPLERLEALQVALTREEAMVDLEGSIHQRVQEQMAQYQKDAYLNEQMRVIRQELGQSDDDDNQKLRQQLEALPMAEESRNKVLDEMARLERMPSGQPDAQVIRTWLETIARLPWGVEDEENRDLTQARQILEEDHDGLTKVKERILEYLAVHQLTGSLNGPILCLVGPPGVGKTSVARSVARCLGRRFVRTSLGGLRDEAELRGHRRTYIGAIPGRIITGLAQVGTANPVFLLDEMDKMRHDVLGDPASAMLEVLDSEQNSAFRDLYLDIPFDLSKVLFLATANSLEDVPRPLMDRMEIIEIEGYTPGEKRSIARNHLIPKDEKSHGLEKDTLKLNDSTLDAIIEGYTREAGVRSLERKIGALCRKLALAKAEGKEMPEEIDAAALETYLGAPKIFPNSLEKEPQIGMAVGMAYNSVGGDTLTIEVSTMPGNGQLLLTGQLGNVMQESAKAAITYIRARSEQYGLPSDFHQKLDIHIHVPEGATPKDGPSAGITMTVALLSALSGRRVPMDLAMTGEITLRGRVLPIGGLKEKLMAAQRDGIRRVLIPKENMRDLDEIPSAVKDALQITPVTRLEEALELALEKA